MRTVPYVLVFLACLAFVHPDDSQDKNEMKKVEKVVVEDKAKMLEPEFQMLDDSDKEEEENEEEAGPLVDQTEKTKSTTNDYGAIRV